MGCDIVQSGKSLPKRLRGVTFQKTVMFIVTTTAKSKLAQRELIKREAVEGNKASFPKVRDFNIPNEFKINLILLNVPEKAQLIVT
jgi:hypothetical protein